MQLKSHSKAGSATRPCQLHLGVSFYLMHNLMWLLAYLHVTKAFCEAPGIPSIKSWVMAKLIQLPADGEGDTSAMAALAVHSRSLLVPQEPRKGRMAPSSAGERRSNSSFPRLQQVRHETSTVVTESCAPYHSCPCWPAANELERANNRDRQETTSLAQL